MKKAEIHEALTALYLRLAGYFTTGLVVHSPEWGFNQAEIDCVAIRLPHHQQPEREVLPPKFLALQDGQTDLLICEVKSAAKDLKFNDGLRTKPEVLACVLRWAGPFDEMTLESTVERARALLQVDVPTNIAREGITEKGVRVRGLLSCPPCEEKDVPNTWFLTGSEILRFAQECFSPPAPRTECSTRYNFHLWGSWLAPLVDYMKRCGRNRPTLDGLYKHLGAG